MEQHSVEDRIHELEQRLQRYEGTSSKSSAPVLAVPLKTSEQRGRFFGWAISIFALLGLISGWGNGYPLIGLFFAIALIIGLVLIASASGFIAHSDSHMELAKEHRPTKKVHAHALHHRASIAGLKATLPIKNDQMALTIGFLLLALLLGWSLAMTFTDPLIQLMVPALALTLVGVWATIKRNRTISFACVLILAILLYVAASPLMALMAALAGFSVIWIAGWESQDQDLLALTGFGLTMVSFGQVYWGIGRLTDAERVAVISAALMGLLLTALSYATSRRDLERRDISRIALVLSPIAALTSVTVAGPYSYPQNLLVGLLLLTVGYGAMAYVGWLSHQRLSYAKYFLAAALGSLLLFVYLFLDPVSVALIWFILAVVVTAAGFTLPSYSARLLGLGLLVVAVLHYLFTILGADQVAGPIFLRDRVWLGIIMGLFLPALGLWYREAKLKTVEGQLGPIITSALSAAGFLILFAIGYLDIPIPYQSMMWLIVALAAMSYGRRTDLRVISIGGFVLILVALSKLLGFDIFTISVGDRLLTLLVVAILLILVGFILPQRSNRRKGLL
jgi:hypothetical protein